MNYLSSIIHAVLSLMAGVLLGTWLFMMCFGPIGFLFFVLDTLTEDTLAWCDALPRVPLGLAMLIVGLLMARWSWRKAPTWRWLIATPALGLGILSVIWIALVMAVAGAVPNFGYGG